MSDSSLCTSSSEATEIYYDDTTDSQSGSSCLSEDAAEHAGQSIFQPAESFLRRLNDQVERCKLKIALLADKVECLDLLNGLSLKNQNTRLESVEKENKKLKEEINELRNNFAVERNNHEKIFGVIAELLFQIPSVVQHIKALQSSTPL